MQEVERRGKRLEKDNDEKTVLNEIAEVGIINSWHLPLIFKVYQKRFKFL